MHYIQISPPASGPYLAPTFPIWSSLMHAVGEPLAWTHDLPVHTDEPIYSTGIPNMVMHAVGEPLAWAAYRSGIGAHPACAPTLHPPHDTGVRRLTVLMSSACLCGVFMSSTCLCPVCSCLVHAYLGVLMPTVHSRTTVPSPSLWRRRQQQQHQHQQRRVMVALQVPPRRHRRHYARQSRVHGAHVQA